MARCIGNSDDGFLSSLRILRPVWSTTTIMSSVIRPLHTIVGVVSILLSSRRTLMFPSVAAAIPLSYILRPMSAIWRRISLSVIIWQLFLVGHRDSCACLNQCGSGRQKVGKPFKRNEEVNVLDLNARSFVKAKRSKVQDGLYSCVYGRIEGGFCDSSWHRNRDHVDCQTRGDLSEVGHTVNLDPVGQLAADLGRVRIEECYDREAAGREAVIVCQCIAQVARPYHSDPVRPVESQNLDEVVA